MSSFIRMWIICGMVAVGVLLDGAAPEDNISVPSTILVGVLLGPVALGASISDLLNKP